MFNFVYSTRFERDLQRCQNKNKDISLIDEVLRYLEKEGKVSNKYKPHPLKGKLKGQWECHIEDDWLLIWIPDRKNKIIELVRTGAHDELFKK
jgi:mRNA interferase YafQ